MSQLFSQRQTCKASANAFFALPASAAQAGHLNTPPFDGEEQPISLRKLSEPETGFHLVKGGLIVCDGGPVVLCTTGSGSLVRQGTCVHSEVRSLDGDLVSNENDQPGASHQRRITTHV